MDEDWISTLNVRTWPLEPLACGRALNRQGYSRALTQLAPWLSPEALVVVAKPSELACLTVDHPFNGPVLYDVMDHMHLFTRGMSSHWILLKHKHLVRRADQCWASSRALITATQALRPRAVSLVPNAATLPEPIYCANLNERRFKDPHAPLVLGYVGSIAPWLDWNRIAALAQALPTSRVELVGPIHTDIPSLPSNVVIKPAIPHSQVYKVMKGFDVGLIPFLRNELTDAVDPVKYYEYRACHLPVLTTRFGEMADKSSDDGVWFFEDVDLEKIDESLVHWHAHLEKAQPFVPQNCWQHRFDTVIHTLPGWDEGCYAV